MKMKKLLAQLLLGAYVALAVAPAMAQIASPTPAPIIAEPVDANSLAGLMAVLLNFAHNGQYLLAGGVITLIICFALNQYILPKLNLGGAIVPLVSPFIGVISGVGLALANGGKPLAAALAVMSGPLAGHLYEAIAQYFVKKPDPAPAPVQSKAA